MKTFCEMKQTQDSSPEAGGLLFAEIEIPRIRVVKATQPSLMDSRSRFGIHFSKKRRAAEIKRQFRKGLHFVGEWHTHPELNPSPSPLDISSMAELFSLSKHQLNYFIMVIVGNSEAELNLWVSLHDSCTYHRLASPTTKPSEENGVSVQKADETPNEVRL